MYCFELQVSSPKRCRTAQWARGGASRAGAGRWAEPPGRRPAPPGPFLLPRRWRRLGDFKGYPSSANSFLIVELIFSPSDYRNGIGSQRESTEKRREQNALGVCPSSQGQRSGASQASRFTSCAPLPAMSCLLSLSGAHSPPLGVNWFQSPPCDILDACGLILCLFATFQKVPSDQGRQAACRVGGSCLHAPPPPTARATSKDFQTVGKAVCRESFIYKTGDRTSERSFILSRMAIFRKQKTQKVTRVVSRMWRNGDPCALPVGT